MNTSSAIDDPVLPVPSTRRERLQPWYALKTEVRPSTIEQAGLGLFMTERAIAGDRIAVYGGDIISADELAATDSNYIVFVNSKQYLDGKRIIPGHKGRYINYGGSGPNSKNNAKLRISRCAYWNDKADCYRVAIYATKPIEPNEEIFMPYGRGWKWPWQLKAKPQHMAHPGTRSDMDSTQACFLRARRQLQQVVTAVVTRVAVLSDSASRRLHRLWNSAVHYMRRHEPHRAGTYITRFVEQTVPVMSESEDRDAALVEHIARNKYDHAYHPKRK